MKTTTGSFSFLKYVRTTKTLRLAWCYQETAALRPFFFFLFFLFPPFLRRTDETINTEVKS